MNVIPEIKIEITITQLNVVVDHLKEIDEVPVIPSKTVNTSLSVLNKVFVKLSKKALNKIAAKKPFSIKLEYYEAYFLEQCLKLITKMVTSRELQNTLDTLNQKIA